MRLGLFSSSLFQVRHTIIPLTFESTVWRCLAHPAEVSVSEFGLLRTMWLFATDHGAVHVSSRMQYDRLCPVLNL